MQRNTIFHSPMWFPRGLHGIKRELCCYVCHYVADVNALHLHRAGLGWNMGIQMVDINTHYRKISNISRTKLSNLNVSRLVVQLSSPNSMKPVVKSCSNCIWVIDNFIAYSGASYIRDLTVISNTSMGNCSGHAVNQIGHSKFVGNDIWRITFMSATQIIQSILITKLAILQKDIISKQT